MIKKSLFKKITALALATCLATSPAVIYAADDAVEVFVEEEAVTQDEASSDENYAEEVFTDNTQVQENQNQEEVVYDEVDFSADVVEEDNEPVFVDDTIVEENASEEQTVTEEVAAAEDTFGVSDEIMEQLVAGNDVLDENVATDDAAYANETVKVTFHANNGTTTTSTQTFPKDGSGQSTLTKNSFTYKGYAFAYWTLNAEGTGEQFPDEWLGSFSGDKDLYAQWAVASIGDNYYSTLDAAITAATTGSVIKILTDITLSATATIPSGKTLTIDLNGKAIKGAISAGLINTLATSLTIINTDTTTKGSITNTSGIAIVADGAVTTLTTNNNFEVKGSTIALSSTDADLSIEGGTFTGSTSNTAIEIKGDSISADTATRTIASTATLSGKYYVSADKYVASGTVTIPTTYVTNSKVSYPETLIPKEPIAGSGITKLLSLGDALNYGGTVKLYNDIVLADTATVVGDGLTAILDLNGKTISNGSNTVPVLIEVGSVANPSILTVINTGSGGGITNTYSEGKAFSLVGASTLNLGTEKNNTTFTVTSNYPTIDGSATAKLNVNCGTITSNKGEAISGFDEITIKAGTITGNKDAINTKGSSLVIKGGTITPGTGSAIAFGNLEEPLAGTLTIESAATIGGTKPLTIAGTTFNAAAVKVYNDSVVQKSVVGLTDGCFWVKGSIADHYELKKASGCTFIEDDSVLVANDFTAAAAIEVNKTIDFDLNGHTITGAAGDNGMEVSAGTLTIYNSNTTTEGKLVGDTGNSGIVVLGSVSDTGSLVVGKSGKLKSTISGGNAIKIDTTCTTGTVKIEGGTITGSSTGVYINSEKATLTVNGGTITGTSGDIYVNNGTVSLYKTATYSGSKNLVVTGFKEVKVYDKAVDTTKTTAVDVGDNLWANKGTYETLLTKEKAFATDGTVKLNDDIDAPIVVSAKVTLDLNGKSIVGPGNKTYAIGIEKGGDLTIINSSTTDSAIGHGSESSIEMLSTGTGTTDPKLTVGSASDTTQNNFIINGDDYGIYDAVACTTTVNGGTINSADGTEYAAIEHDAGTLTVVNGTITSKGYAVAFNPAATTTASTAILKGGAYDGTVAAVYEHNKNLSSLKITGGAYKGAFTVTNVKQFMTGGVYSVEPLSRNVASGYDVTKNTDSGAATYPWRVYSSTQHYTLTLAYTPTAASTAPTSDADDLTDLAPGTKVTVKAQNANTGYTFDGWYNESKSRVATTQSYTYTVGSTNATLTAVYTKDLTVTIKDDTVVSGSAYEPKNTVDNLTVTGLDSTDTALGILDTSAMKLTSTYNKDTSAIGTTYPITQTGLKVKTSTSTVPKYNLKTTTNGTLTVIAGTGPEEFIAEVNKLPAATAVTVDNLAATKTAVEKAKADYAKLSTASKNLDTVKAAKTKLDAVDAAVTKLDTDKKAADAADKLIQALPAAKDATSADREKLDAATKAFNALTADQKKLVPTADQTKLADVTKAVEAAEKADKEAAAAVKNLIDALPTVAEATAADRDALTEAQKAYDALTPAQKKLLPGAEATLEALDEVITAAENDKKAADAVTAKINALPDPEDATKEDREKVDAAKDALAALTPAQQKLVPQTAKDRLEAVDEAVKAKEDDTDQKAADAAMEKIEAIKKQPAGKGKAATEEARAAYDALTDAQKALLPKSAEDQLVAAEEAYTKDRTFQCGDAMYKVLPSGNVSYNRPADTKCTSAVVPNQIKKNGYLYKVVKVSIGAFKNCESLVWVVINKNVGAIGKYAFKNTPSLTKINIKSKTLKTGKVVSAFAGGGKSKGAKLLVKTPSSYVSSYNSLFKGEGLLNKSAKVQAA